MTKSSSQFRDIFLTICGLNFNRPLANKTYRFKSHIQGVSAKTFEPNTYLGYLPTDFYEI
jgi:hypothetical protein